MKEQNIICPACDGNGWIVDEDISEEGIMKAQQTPCCYCGGVGEVPENHLEVL